MTINDTKQVSLAAEVPPVVTEPRITIVRCGNTTVEVKEHGAQGSRSWAARTGGNHIIGAGGTKDYPYEQAIEDAAEYVRRAETARLLREQLTKQLEADHQDPP